LTRLLYLHGFASGPGSSKGVALARHYEAKGLPVERLDLRVPSMERLRLSEMLEVVRRAVGGPTDRAVLMGSSLGGLAAARAAERDPRVAAVVLLAPAFGFVGTWEERLGPEAWAAWKLEGREVQDYAAGGSVRVDFGFIEDAARLESAGPPRVSVPTLIVHGKDDETVPVRVSRDWARGRPNVRLVETDDGHELKASLPVIMAEADRFLPPFFPDGNW
jgi:uncharacterized protein